MIAWAKVNSDMSEAILPSVPPVSPFDAYTIIIVLPFLMRLIFVAPPLLDLSQKFLPKDDRTKHARWALDRIKKLNAERFWLIVVNELLAVVLPGAIAVAARLYMGPIGWESWEIPFLGLALVGSGLLYIGVSTFEWGMLTLVCIFFSHGCSGVSWVFSTTLLQRRSDNEWMGRVAGTDSLVITLTMGVSTIFAGLAMEHEVVTLREMLLITAGIQISVGMLWLLLASPGERSHMAATGA